MRRAVAKIFSSQMSRNTMVGTISNFGTYKTSTGLVGLAVDKNGKENLLSISAEILDAVKKVPETSQYRVNIEKWFNFISKVAKSTDDVKQIETEIGLGQIEEVIDMAKDERKLVDYYYENRGWELVAEAQRDADAIVDAMADNIYFSDPEKYSSKPQPPPQQPPKIYNVELYGDKATYFPLSQSQKDLIKLLRDYYIDIQ